MENSNLNKASCQKCSKLDNKLWMCKCTACKRTFHFKCVPERKLFEDVLCHECCLYKDPELVSRLVKTNELLRSELKKCQELIRLYQEQADQCTSIMEEFINAVGTVEDSNVDTSSREETKPSDDQH